MAERVAGLVVTIAIIVLMLTVFRGWVATNSSPDEIFGFWYGVRDGSFFVPRFILKNYEPVDLYADHHTTGYAIGFVFCFLSVLGQMVGLVLSVLLFRWAQTRLEQGAS